MNIKDTLSKIEQAYSDLEKENKELRQQADLLGRVVISTCPLAHNVPAETEGVVITFMSNYLFESKKRLPAIGVRFDSAVHDTHWFTVDILDFEPSKKAGVPKIMDPFLYRQEKSEIKKIFAHFNAERRKLQAWQEEAIEGEAN